MKVQTVYPSTVMRIACPNCGVEGTLRKDRPPERDFTVLCPKCKERFLVKINARKFYRKKVSIPVRYSLFNTFDPMDKKVKEGIIIDISREGLCIESYTHFFLPDYHREGNLLNLQFSLPRSEKLLKVQAKVMRVIKKEGENTFKMGLQFHNLDEFTNKQIGFFLWP